MRNFYVQLLNVDHAVAVAADGNPEVQRDESLGESFLVFTRNDEVIGKFSIRHVIGWWCTN